MRPAVIILALLLVPIGLAQQTPVGPLLGPVPVVRVVDGDTVVLESNLGPRVVRLIGIDTPEVSHPEKGREPFGPEASAFTEQLLPEGELVWVELDLETEDAYGRLLVYLYLEDPDGSWRVEGRPAVQVNEEIAAAGFARVLTIEPNAMYADLYEQAVEAARQANRGMWAVEAQADPEPAPAEGEGDRAGAGAGTGPISIACALYNPDTPGDDGEWVELMIHEPLDTRGYYLWDEGSETTLPLPPGVQPPGKLRITHEGQGIWNNSGDTIYLERAGELIDAWDYTDYRAPEGTVICRDD